jgi:hypothetical protein
MIKHWTIFEGRPFAGDRDQPRVTLDRRSTILLNAAACEHLKGPTAVQLMFDENLKRIGIRPADPREPNAFRLKRKKGATHRTIAAGAFCQHFGISVNKTVRFNDPAIDRDGIMTLELADTTYVTRGSR